MLEQLVEVAVLLAVRQDLQAVLVVAHELLVDVEHGQQDVEQVGCKAGGLSGGRAPAPALDPAAAQGARTTAEPRTGRGPCKA